MHHLQISFDHKTCPQSKALRAYVTEKLSKVVHHARFFKVHITISIHNNQHVVKALCFMPKKHVVFLSMESDNMYTSVDLLMPRLERMMHAYLEKLRQFEHRDINRLEKN